MVPESSHHRPIPGEILTRKTLSRLARRNRSGQGLFEYVLIIALASVGLVLVLLVFRNQIGNGVDNAKASVQDASQSPYVPGGSPGRGRGGGGRGGGRNSGS